MFFMTVCIYDLVWVEPQSIFFFFYEWWCEIHFTFNVYEDSNVVFNAALTCYASVLFCWQWSCFICAHYFLMCYIVTSGVCLPTSWTPQHRSGQSSSHALRLPVLHPEHPDHTAGQDERDCRQILPWQLGKRWVCYKCYWVK